MRETTNPSAPGVQPCTGVSMSNTLPLPTRLPAAFTLKGVYQVKAGITVVDGVEVDIPHGEIIALVGPSGAGKTSLLRLLNPTATLLEHALLTQGFMSTSKVVSLVAGDRKIVILRGQFCATHSSVAVGL